MPNKTIVDLIQENASKMTIKQKILGSYVISNYRNVAFMNARDLARNTNVSESTVLRFVSYLGFQTFTDFQKNLRKTVQERITNLETLNMYEIPSNERRGIVYDVFALEQSIIAKTLGNINMLDFERAIDLLYSKKYVFLVGFGSDDVIVRYAAKFFRLFRDGVFELSTMSSDIDCTQYIEMSNNDNSVALVYSAPRYYKNAIDVALDFKEKNVTIIAVTDNTISPLSQISDITFVTTMRYITVVDPLCSMMAMTHALLTGVVSKDPKRAIERTKKYYKYSNKRNMCIMSGINVKMNI